jgi:L-seryl-tRNA(Ser) seleniumtransferase
MNEKELVRQIPSVDQLLNEGPLAELRDVPRVLVVDTVRERLACLREDILQGKRLSVNQAEIVKECLDSVNRKRAGNLRKVINATGVVLHTNLGRAVLSREARRAVSAVAEGYSNLEIEMATGARGTRYSHTDQWLRFLTGAEASMVVNNNAAAVLLVLSTLAKGGEVVVSRDELVEIGGGFRVPEVMAASGARLVEVGTTNKTNIRDYERAISGDTAALLKVHTSNFRLIGFT